MYSIGPSYKSTGLGYQSRHPAPCTPAFTPISPFSKLNNNCATTPEHFKRLPGSSIWTRAVFGWTFLRVLLDHPGLDLAGTGMTQVVDGPYSEQHHDRYESEAVRDRLVMFPMVSTVKI